MADISSVMFFKVRFTISQETHKDLLWDIVEKIRAWQLKKAKKANDELQFDKRVWTKLKNGGRINGSRRILESVYFCPDNSNTQYWACKITENPIPPKGYAPRRWITEIGFEQEIANEATFSCVISYSDMAGFIGPYQEAPEPSVPNVIWEIVNDENYRVTNGIDVLINEPKFLKVGDWPEFINRIKNPERKLPYIYVSPDWRMQDLEDGLATIYTDTADLAEKLFGNAVIYESIDPAFSMEMKYMDEDYACYDGAIRVYQPHETEAYRHRYITTEQIEEMGDNLEQYLHRAFVENINYYESFFRIEDCIRKKEEYLRKTRLAEIHNRHREELQEAHNAESYLFDLAAEEEEKRLEAEERVSNLEQKLKECESQNYEYESQLENLRNAAQENRDLRKSLDARFDIAELPITIDDVVNYFKTFFADKLVFSDECLKSMKQCRIEPKELWKVCFALAVYMKPIYDKGGADPYSEFKNRTGIVIKRGEGTMTRNDTKLMRQFVIDMNGEKIDIEPHITYPKIKQSIHVGYSEKTRKIVVGHCGEHLEIYSTRKMK